MNINLTAPYGPLVRRIETEATVIGDQVLKIDHFLNHRIEPRFITEMGGELARRLAQFEPSVVLTAEASGIAPGLVVAQALDIPLVYAKKYAPQSANPSVIIVELVEMNRLFATVGVTMSHAVRQFSQWNGCVSVAGAR